MTIFRQIRRFQGAELVPDDTVHDNLLFLHLEKTAGMSTRLFLSKLFGDTVVSPHTDHRDFADLAPKFPLLVGHVDHAHATRHLGSFGWFTILRNPIDRVVSIMNFWAKQVRNNTHHWTNGTETEREAYQMASVATFEDFVSSPNAKITDQLQNLACRRITGLLQGNLSDEDYADLAFNRLQSEAIFFGLQEHYHLSMLQIALMMDIQIETVDFQGSFINQSPVKRLSRWDVKDINKSVLGADILLYEQAGQLFQQRMNRMSHHLFHMLAKSEH